MVHQKKILKIIILEGSSMKVYSSENIRNVALIGHGGSGKIGRAHV